LAGLLISVAFVAAVVIWAAHQDTPQLPSTPGRAGALAGALAVYVLATLIRGERWFRLLRRHDASSGRVDATAILSAGYMANNVLPARAGDVLRVYLQAQRAGAGYRSVTGTLIAERVLDVGFLAAMFGVLAFGALRGIDTPSGDGVLVVAALGAVTLSALAVVLIAGRGNDRVERLVEWARPLWRSTADLRGSYGATVLALTAAIWFAEAACYWACAASVGLDASALEALYLVAVAGVFILIPSGPGYAGTLDAGIVFGAKAIGATGSQAVGYLLAVRFVLLLPITIAGLVVLFGRFGGARALAASRRGAPSDQGQGVA